MHDPDAPVTRSPRGHRNRSGTPGSVTAPDVGAGRVGEALAGADPFWLAAVAGFALAQLTVWGQTLRTVPGALGADSSASGAE